MGKGRAIKIYDDRRNFIGAVIDSLSGPGKFFRGLLEELEGEDRDRSKMAVELSDAARAWLLKEGYDPAYGARPLRRAIQRYVENPISKGILDGAYVEGDTIAVDANAEGLTFAKK